MTATTVFATIQQALVDALLAAPALADGRVEGSRSTPVPAEWVRHIEVRLAVSNGSNPFAGRNTPTLWTSRVSVECYARANAGDDPNATLDLLLSDVATRLAALQPADLGVTDIAPAVYIQWDWDAGGAAQALATYSFDITHDTRDSGLRPV